MLFFIFKLRSTFSEIGCNDRLKVTIYKQSFTLPGRKITWENLSSLSLPNHFICDLLAVMVSTTQLFNIILHLWLFHFSLCFNAKEYDAMALSTWVNVIEGKMNKIDR